MSNKYFDGTVYSTEPKDIQLNNELNDLTPEVMDKLINQHRLHQ